MPSTDGSLDTRGETADINQGIESHDGMDTNTSTLRVEREATGTDIPPSQMKNQMRQSPEKAPRQFSLLSEANSARAASKQLAKEKGIKDVVKDILSDKLNPIR